MKMHKGKNNFTIHLTNDFYIRFFYNCIGVKNGIRISYTNKKGIHYKIGV